MTRYLCFQVVAFAIFAATLLPGWPQFLWASDDTHLIVGTLVVTLLAAITPLSERTRPWLVWVCDNGITLMLGLMGTVLGFMIAVQGMVTDQPVQKFSGVGTAQATTIAGIVSHLYLILLERWTRR